MIRCLHILKAYAHRIVRRHQTLFSIILFTGILLTIFRIYAYHHADSKTAHTRGNFQYQPGLFLRERQPDENRTFCQFNYGLPEKLDLKATEVNYSPELGSKSNYRVVYDAILGTEYANNSNYNAVTYATQTTPEFLYHIVEIAKYWDGPISLSIFTPDYDLDISFQILKHLCSCYENMTKVSVHLFFPKNRPPKIYEKVIEVTTTQHNISVENLLKNKLDIYRSLNNKARHEYVNQVRENKAKRIISGMNRKFTSPVIKFDNCGDSDFNTITYRRDYSLMYPINVGRNVARNRSKTNYYLVSDIEMVPSEGLAPKFLEMLRNLMGDKKREEGCIFSNTVFVVPLFEVDRGEKIPRTKSELVRLIAENRAFYFHQKLCPHCQRFPGLMSWLKRPSPGGVEPMLIGRREYPYARWEPLYFGTHKDPWYNEKLTWEGRQDKMAQMFIMCLEEYSMMIIEDGFLCHNESTEYFLPLEEHLEIFQTQLYVLKDIFKVIAKKYEKNTLFKFCQKIYY